MTKLNRREILIGAGALTVGLTLPAIVQAEPIGVPEVFVGKLQFVRELRVRSPDLIGGVQGTMFIRDAHWPFTDDFNLDGDEPGNFRGVLRFCFARNEYEDVMPFSHSPSDARRVALAVHQASVWSAKRTRRGMPNYVLHSPNTIFNLAGLHQTLLPTDALKDDELVVMYHHVRDDLVLDGPFLVERKRYGDQWLKAWVMREERDIMAKAADYGRFIKVA